MTNVFQTPYESRLSSWSSLREELKTANILDVCTTVDEWWQCAPLVNHYLHPHDIDSWPGPWDLLADNTYCTLARGLGITYTLLLLGISDVDLCLGKDDNQQDVALVIVQGQYILNYWRDTVKTNKLTDFVIETRISTDSIRKFLP